MAKDDKSTTNGSPLKISMSSLRLTGDQAERLLTIHRAKAVECYEHWDWRLRDLGLVVIGPIPPHIKSAKEKWIAATWVKVRNMAGIKTPSLSKIKEIEGLLNQMNHAAYRLNKKYSTLTAVGAELAANGRVVILPRDTPATPESE
jgi:hypothetical protein